MHTGGALDPVAKINEAMRRVNSKYSDEADGIFSLVQTYFAKRPLFCTDSCTRYRPLSDSCEALLEGSADECPMFDELVDGEREGNEEYYR
jgi:hypothetical protein